jgi:hypothetical protein
VRAGGRQEPRPGRRPLERPGLRRRAALPAGDRPRDRPVGREALVQAKSNQKKILAACKRIAAARTPLLPASR